MFTRRRFPALCAAAALSMLAACGNGADDSATTAAPGATTSSIVAEIPLETRALPPADYAAYRSQMTACGAEAPPEARELTFPSPDDMAIDADERPTATITTSCGAIVVELDPSLAPETVNSFVFLAGRGYFDGTVSHRILPGFVIQAGDPTATGGGGPGYVIADEPPPAGFVYVRGTLAMANAGPGTTGSQFFIVLGDTVQLPPDYSVFGRVVDGHETLDAIAAVPVGPAITGEPSAPLETVYIESIAVER